MLTGGRGADVFVYTDAGDSGTGGGNRDVIRGFAGADVIDLSAVDADSATAGLQNFSFIGTTAFSGTAGELRVQSLLHVTLVQADTNGDGVKDFEIALSGNIALNASDFVL